MYDMTLAVLSQFSYGAGHWCSTVESEEGIWAYPLDDPDDELLLAEHDIEMVWVMLLTEHHPSIHPAVLKALRRIIADENAGEVDPFVANIVGQLALFGERVYS
jgi:hypothetical protein